MYDADDDQVASVLARAVACKASNPKSFRKIFYKAVGDSPSCYAHEIDLFDVSADAYYHSECVLLKALEPQ